METRPTSQIAPLCEAYSEISVVSFVSVSKRMSTCSFHHVLCQLSRIDGPVRQWWRVGQTGSSWRRSEQWWHVQLIMFGNFGLLTGVDNKSAHLKQLNQKANHATCLYIPSVLSRCPTVARFALPRALDQSFSRCTSALEIIQRCLICVSDRLGRCWRCCRG